MFSSRFVLALLGILCLCGPARSATCFWVGGAGTWDNSTDAAHWSSSSGGSGSTCAAAGGFPKNASDIATFDGSSGGGTVTNNTSLAISQITMGAFTGTLDFSTNNLNQQLQVFSGTGTGVRTLNLGNGTWTIAGTGGSSTCWDMTTTTNLTFNANSSTIQFTTSSSSNRSMVAGGLTYNVVTVQETTAGRLFTFSGSGTFNTLNINSNAAVGNGTTLTLTTLATNASSGSQHLFGTTSGTGTVSISAGTTTLNWLAMQNVTYSGGATFVANNSFNLGGNTGITINAPSGGGGKIIGG